MGPKLRRSKRYPYLSLIHIFQTIHDEAERYYDAENVYLVGDSTSDYDLSVSFARDNVMISVLSVAFVIIVLLFTFQSVGLPLLLILVIQGSIWISFSFPLSLIHIYST